MRTRTCLAVLAVLMLVPAAAAQTSSRIAFASDRESTDFDLYAMEDDGDNQTQESEEAGAARRPSYSRNGRKLVYDVEGDLYILSTVGSANPTNMTPNHCGIDQDLYAACDDVDAGPMLNSTEFLVVYTGRESTANSTGDIILATVNGSTGTLSNHHLITNDDGGTGSLIDYHPAWCGSHHVIWSREVPNDCEPGCVFGELYYWELCIAEVDENGLVGDPPAEPTCYLKDVTHPKANQHPSCNADGTMVAFAESIGDTKDVQTEEYFETPHKICTMDLEAGSQQDIEESVLCLPGSSSVDDTNPAWSPGGTLIAFASQRVMEDSTTDYEIWAVNSEDIINQTPASLTNNAQAIPDNDPDWGPSLLP